MEPHEGLCVWRGQTLMKCYVPAYLSIMPPIYYSGLLALYFKAKLDDGFLQRLKTQMSLFCLLSTKSTFRFVLTRQLEHNACLCLVCNFEDIQ